MSINKLISIKNPIVDTIDELGIPHQKDIPWFTKLATKGEIEIGSAYQYQRTRKVLDIKGCTACLPNDCVLVEIGILGDQGESCADLFNTVCGNLSGTVTNMAGQANFLVIDIGGSVGETVGFGYINYSYQDNKFTIDDKCHYC